MDTKSPPRISVVALTRDGYVTIRQTVRHLAAQTIAHDLELILCTPCGVKMNEIVSDLQPFHSWRVVEPNDFSTMGAAKAIGVRQCRAPLVVFAEDHSFPEPRWAEALVEAHAAGNAAVAPQMKNANPESMLSWADLILGFAPWIAPAQPGRRPRLPAHNSGYDRDLLLSLGEDLVTMLDDEGHFHSKLNSQGRTLFLAPVFTRHVNHSLLGSFVQVQFHGGRAFGGSRVQNDHWPWHKRLVYICGAPLVPLVRLRRTMDDLRACGRTKELLPRLLPALLLGLCAHATGEAVGTAFGGGNSTRRKADFEFHRDHHVRQADKELWAI